MISIDPQSKKSSLKSVTRKGRLVRSLDFTDPNPANARTRRPKSIWRDQTVAPQSTGFTTHKMSSVTNNFMTSDLSVSSDSEIDEMVGDLVEPGRATLVFPRHDEVFRTSPLSSSSYILEDTNDEPSDDVPVIPVAEPEFNNFCNSADAPTMGMSWNPKRNQWIPLIYRYVFPSSAFTVNNNNTFNSNNNTCNNPTRTTWSLKNGQLTDTSSSNTSNRKSSSFSFPPPKKSIMMGPDGLTRPACVTVNNNNCIDLDARDVCEKLLELMDDENLMLPVVKISPRGSSPSNNTTTVNNALAHNPPITGKSLLSEWSSLPSSPPPPIFHDVCNRPIPELRLSPPMSGKSISKRLFPNAIAVSTTAANNANSPCESPLTKRLKFSSSSSSIASQ